MIRLLVGLALLPLSGSLFWVAAKTLAGVAVGSAPAAPFAAGMGMLLAAWATARCLPAASSGPAAWAARAARWSFVLSHELTHALAAWATGGSVYALSVGEKEGHVDLSHSSAFVALAPYCFPLHALALVAGYRVLLWLKPEAGGEALFLFLMGAALGAHLLFTWDCLTSVRQPDLDAAGGIVFSWSLIAMANALLLMIMLKGLFPEAVPLLARLREAGGCARRFWGMAWLWGKPLVSAAGWKVLS